MNATAQKAVAAIPPTRYFVFMGVSGVGKSTVAGAAAEALSGHTVEADDFHSPENVAAMSAGHGLTDAQRWPWLEAVCKGALEAGADGGLVMIACSALKARYRALMRERLPHPLFLYLKAPGEVIRQRMMHRTSHFMAAAMLDGQLADLEEPDGETDCLVVDTTPALSEVTARSVALCRKHAATAT